MAAPAPGGDDRVFCDIAAGHAPATIVRRWPQALAIVPLDPVTPGHLLVVPYGHVTDAGAVPLLSALTIAGRQDTLFSDDAVELIHLPSRGLPRSVNNIAWQSPIAAFTEEKGIVDESSTRTAITETHATE
ncbi:hypothetical protein ACH4U5_38315 [Streptomyces sp. NPDC020858]|uniref:hypothetical protein n=1 Tax=Streptomyces sp. NPDC020858 TaxID=3365097 RepID=UPI0037945F10